jgi:hypothetical protein
MTERVLGEKGSKRRTRFLLLPVLATIMVSLFWISGASAVHDLGLFQLDRNAEDAVPATGSDDWNTPPSPAPGHAAVFTGILADSASSPGDQFQGGGSKDNNDLDQWLYKAGEPLDKDDITNAYAAGYVNTVDTGANNIGDFIVYFGLDRFATDGSAQVGFWFFKGAISQTTDAAGGGFKFAGAHQVGDVLVQSNFSNGGVISSISVFEWVGSGGSNGSLNLLFSGSDCVGPPPQAADDPACATVNQADTPAPWSYTPKSGTPGTFPTSAFFEGGINLTRLVPNIGCVSSFLAETRSSTPFDSRLKDLKLGTFNTCRVSVDTNASPTGTNVVPGTSVSDTAIVTGTSLTGGTAPTPTGTLDFYLCQPAAVTAAGCPTGSGDKVGATKTLGTGGCLATGCASDSTTNTTTVGKYCWRAHYTPATGSPYSPADFTNAGDECFTTVAQPTTTTTRQFVFPQDKAKITASSGGDLAGNVTFKLYDTSANCTANTATGLLLTDGPHTIAGASPQFATTNNTTARVTSDTTVYWRVTYVSTNAAQLGSSSACLESTAVTFAGNDGTIAIP